MLTMQPYENRVWGSRVWGYTGKEHCVQEL